MRSEINPIRARIQEKLNELGKEMGITILLSSSATYTENDFTTKITVTKAGSVNEAKELIFKKNTKWTPYADLYGKTITSRGRTFTINGFKPRSSKYPIIATSPDGQSYKFSRASVEHLIGK